MIARYSFDEIKGWKPFGQAAFVYQSKSTPTLRVDQTQIIGTQPAYGLLDLIGGATHDNMTVQLIVTNVTNKLAQLSRFAQTVPSADNQPYIIPDAAAHLRDPVRTEVLTSTRQAGHPARLRAPGCA